MNMVEEGKNKTAASSESRSTGSIVVEQVPLSYTPAALSS